MKQLFVWLLHQSSRQCTIYLRDETRVVVYHIDGSIFWLFVVIILSDYLVNHLFFKLIRAQVPQNFLACPMGMLQQSFHPRLFKLDNVPFVLLSINVEYLVLRSSLNFKLFYFILQLLVLPYKERKDHEWNSLSLTKGISEWLSAGSPSKARFHQKFSYSPILFCDVQRHQSNSSFLVICPIPVVPHLLIPFFINLIVISDPIIARFWVLLFINNTVVVNLEKTRDSDNKWGHLSHSKSSWICNSCIWSLYFKHYSQTIFLHK